MVRGASSLLPRSLRSRSPRVGWMMVTAVVMASVIVARTVALMMRAVQITVEAAGSGTHCWRISTEKKQHRKK